MTPKNNENTLDIKEDKSKNRNQIDLEAVKKQIMDEGKLIVIVGKFP